jgi:glycosyltransferase involved in cell wall biosynthesis
VLVFILYLFIGALVIQLFFWLVIFAPFAFRNGNNNSNVTAQQQPVSVIICAKNEAHNLSKYLREVLTQKYNTFEVIVVDDNSTDNTKTIIENLQKEYNHLKYVFLSAEEKKLPGKRSAILKGIEHADYEWLVFTDADCRPASLGWLRYITRPLFEGKEIAIGFSTYKYEFGLLNALIRYETVYTALQYFSFASIGLPYMAVGRNMAYTKTFFYKSKQFFQEQNTLSGDDDLLINELATANNFGLVWNNNAKIISVPNKTYTAWFNQKMRHYTAGFQYKIKHKVILGTLYTSSLTSSILLIILFTINKKIEILFLILLMKLVIQLIVSYKLLNKFKESGLLVWMLVLDFFFPMILVTLATASIFYKQNIAWKNN